jgi:hydroxymethylbilane synthase
VDQLRLALLDDASSTDTRRLVDRLGRGACPSEIDVERCVDPESEFERLAKSLRESEVDLALCRATWLPAALPETIVVAAAFREHEASYLCASRRPPVLGILPAKSTVLAMDAVARAQIRHLYPWLFVGLAPAGVEPGRLTSHASWDALCLPPEMAETEAVRELRTEPISPEIVLPRVGQGVTCMLARAGDEGALSAARAFHEEEVATCLEAERLFLGLLDLGDEVCATARATRTKRRTHVTGLVAQRDGAWVVVERAASQVSPASVAFDVAVVCRQRAKRSSVGHFLPQGSARP